MLRLPETRARAGAHAGRASLAAVLAGACLAAAVILVASDRWGLGVSYDSVVYVQASHSLSSIPLSQPRDQGGKALYWWAPVYPLALRAFGSSYSGARMLNALLLLLGTVLVGLSAWWSVGRSAGVIAAWLYAFSPAVVSAHLSLLAEPLFLLLEVAALALIASDRSLPAGLAAGLATLTRYAGLPLIVTGGIVLRGRERVRFLAAGLGLYVGWLIRNELAAGETTGRQLDWHPPTASDVEQGVRSLIHLAVTPGSLASIHLPFGDPGLLLQSIAGLAVVFGIARSDLRVVPRLVSVGFAFAVVYLAFLLVTKSLFDALTPFNDRIFVPLVPPLVVAAAWVLRAQPVVATVLCLAFLVASLQISHTFRAVGADYSGQVWSRARISGSSLPREQLYSAWPAAVAYFTGRSPRRMPEPVDEHTTHATPNFAQQVTSIKTDIRGGRSALIFFDESFLQIPNSGPPAKTLADLQSLCRRIQTNVYLCIRTPV